MTIVPLVVGYFAIQWNRANYLGKSPEQIVAMGRDKWTDLYGKKVGDSTKDMCDAQEKYATALRNLNERAMKRLPRTRQTWLQSMRKDAVEYASTAHQIGSILTGGGTIWQPINATIAPDVEELVADSIVGKKMPLYKMKSFDAAMDELKVVINQSKDDVGEHAAELPMLTQKMSHQQKQLEALLAHANTNDVTRVRLFMHKKIDVAKGSDMR